MQIVIAGASGFVGQALVPYLKEQGHTVRILSRRPKAGEFFWDPKQQQLNPEHLEGSDCIINLAGESIIGRWNQEKMEKIRESRFLASQLLVDTVKKLTKPPKLYIGASAIGFYGDRGNEKLTESSTSGHGYLAEVARKWEEIPQRLEVLGVRVASLRLAVVLGKGGALAKMLPTFKMGFAGTLGSGKQMMSWIAIQDLCSIFQFVIEGDLKGAINCSAPNPVTNYEFTKTLGRILHRPTLFPLPEFVIKLLFGSGSEIFLASLNVVPEKLEKAGFVFAYPQVEQALQAQTSEIWTQS